MPQKFSLVRRSRFFQNHIHQRARVTTGYPLATVWGNSEFLLEKFLSFIMRQGVGTPPGVGVRFLQSGSETPAAFIPRFSGVPYGFNRVHSIRNSPISLASGCSTFHPRALVMRRSGVRFSSRAPVNFWKLSRFSDSQLETTVRKGTQNARSLNTYYE